LGAVIRKYKAFIRSGKDWKQEVVLFLSVDCIQGNLDRFIRTFEADIRRSCGDIRRSGAFIRKGVALGSI